MRLPGFPVPHEGETVASVVARFLGQTAGHKRRKLDLLGLNQNASLAIVPLDFQKLTAAMPIGHPWCDDSQMVLERHTLVPLYLHFAHPKRAADAVKSFLDGNCGNPAAALGMTKSGFGSLARSIKFCPICVEEDLHKRGCSVIYREHQPVFVLLCTVHMVPLRLSCINCARTRNSARFWQRAGACQCQSPICPPVIELGIDPLADAAWLWMAKQVKSILADHRFPKFSLIEKLRQSVRDSKFWSGNGIDSAAILERLEVRFGQAFLSAVGVTHSSGGRRSQAWPGRLLGKQTLVGERLPDVVRALLITSLVANDITDLIQAPTISNSVPTALPRGYAGEKKLSRDMLTRKSIQSAFTRANGTLDCAAKVLGVSSDHLAVDMRRLGMRHPLSAESARRLGDMTVSSVRLALRSGEPKLHIQSRLGVSSWTIQLVLLDDPELASAHRLATIELQRFNHRKNVTEYMKVHPHAGRTDITRACVSAVDWLRRFDRAWLIENLPKRKVALAAKRLPRKSWTEIDRECVKKILSTCREELNKSERPIRLTLAFLLKSTGTRVEADLDRQLHYPKTLLMAQKCVESEDSFYKRKFAWALKEYKALAVPISTNRLRRIAGVPPARLLEQREFIIAEARRLRISIDARCFLSPLE